MKTISISVEKNSLTWSFDWDAFIKDIEIKHGKDTANYIKKAICFTGCKYRLSEDIFRRLMYNAEKSDERSLVNIVPALEEYEDVVYMQILENWDKYFSEDEGLVYKDKFPLGRILGMYLGCFGDTLWITLENEKGEKKSVKSRFINQVIVDSIEWASRRVNSFDESFEELDENDSSHLLFL